MAPSSNNGDQSGTARFLGSAASGVLELLGFHPVDTVTKRLMNNSSKVLIINNRHCLFLKSYLRQIQIKSYKQSKIQYLTVRTQLLKPSERNIFRFSPVQVLLPGTKSFNVSINSVDNRTSMTFSTKTINHVLQLWQAIDIQRL